MRFLCVQNQNLKFNSKLKKFKKIKFKKIKKIIICLCGFTQIYNNIYLKCKI